MNFQNKISNHYYKETSIKDGFDNSDFDESEDNASPADSSQDKRSTTTTTQHSDTPILDKFALVFT